MLRFNDTNGVFTAVGFNANSKTPPPVGASEVIALVLDNDGAQFGKPSATAVGHVLIDCTAFSTNGNGDGTCSGIAHVPSR